MYTWWSVRWRAYSTHIHKHKRIESIRLIMSELEYRCVLKNEYCHISKCLCMFGLFCSQANCGKSHRICHANFKRIPIKRMEDLPLDWMKLKEYLKIVFIVAHCFEFCISLLKFIKLLRLSHEISKFCWFVVVLFIRLLNCRSERYASQIMRKFLK